MMPVPLADSGTFGRAGTVSSELAVMYHLLSLKDPSLTHTWGEGQAVGKIVAKSHIMFAP